MKNDLVKSKSHKTLWEVFYHRTQHLPTALTGLALGLCGIGACIDTNIMTFDSEWKWWISCGFIFVAAILLILASIRNSIHPKILKFELREPMASSFLPTFAMALMCIAGFIAGWQHGIKGIPPTQVIGAIVMVFAIAVHCVLCFYFTKDVLFKHKWHEDNMYGTWFVPSVGLATACTLTGRFNQNILPNEFFQAIWYFTFVSYLALFFVVTYSLLFKKQVSKERFPSLAVYFAPAGLTATSYLVTFAVPYANAIEMINPNGEMIFNPDSSYINFYPHTYITTLLVLMVCMSFTYAILLFFIFSVRILRQQYSYIFASLTFPLSINAEAMMYTGNYAFILERKYAVHNLIFLNDVAWFFRIVGYIFVILATILILYIAVRFIMNIIRDLTTPINDDKHHMVYMLEQQAKKELAEPVKMN